MNDTSDLIEELEKILGQSHTLRDSEKELISEAVSDLKEFQQLKNVLGGYVKEWSE